MKDSIEDLGEYDFEIKMDKKSNNYVKLDLILSKLNYIFEEVNRKLNNWHYESAKSALNILASIYFDWLNKDNRIFLLSKSHSSIALYSIFIELGYLKFEDIDLFARPESKLQSHPEKDSFPTILVSTGSLGQCLSIAAGIALAKRIDNEHVEIAVLLGDGELNEGLVWESIATIAHYRLSNIIAIVDRNFRQLSGPTDKIKDLEPIEKKFQAFNWYAMRCDGNSINEILEALNTCSSIKEKPKAIICETSKDKR